MFEDKLMFRGLETAETTRVSSEGVILAGHPAGIVPILASLRDSAAPAPSAVLATPSDLHAHGLRPATDHNIYATLEEAMARQGAARVVACQPMSRAQARTLLMQVSASGRQVFAPEGVEGGSLQVRPWALRDVLSPDLATRLDPAARAWFRDKRVIVTGAGGSIGSALVLELASCRPAWIGLLDYSEYNVFQIEHLLRAKRPEQAFTPMLCDIRDSDGVRRWFERCSADLVFHAAALKHVPIVEQHPCEGVLTNVHGACNVARAARATGADLIFVSTDKAANPLNVMGATKRLGELLCLGWDKDGGTRHVPVRLGNVLGSAGSVSPLFAAQIAQGGPVTVTHPSVTRYFITIQQAAEFLLRAAVSALASPQRGLLRILEMGDPIKVMDLARIMIMLSGARPDIDIPITLVGLRPGEKLAEQLIADGEEIVDSDSSGVHAVRSPARDLGLLEAEIETLLGLARAGRDEVAARTLHRIVGSTTQPTAMAG